jgi:hypothetical protein
VDTPPQRTSPSTGARLTVKGDGLVGTDGPVWPALLGLSAYSMLSGGLALGVGHVMASATQSVLSASLVRVSSILTVVVVVVAAGLAAEPVLCHVVRLISSHTHEAERRN